MIGHLFASLVIEYTVFALITVHMANILAIDHANLIFAKECADEHHFNVESTVRSPR